MLTQWMQRIVILLLYFVSCAVFAHENIISLADIHFSPFMGCENFAKPCPLVMKLQQTSAAEWGKVLATNNNKDISTAYHETNYFLLESALQAAHAAAEKHPPQFVFILGDSLAHHYRKLYRKFAKDRSSAGYQLFVKNTFQFLASEIQKTFPETTIYFINGNNDSYTNNYSVVPEGSFLHDIAAIWAPMLHDEASQAEFLKDFPTAGYYAVTVPGHENQKIIVLNSVLFSSHIKNKLLDKAADQQLIWLTAELKKAAQAKQHVMIALHIPMGIDLYESFLRGLTGVHYFWRGEYSVEFTRILKQFPDVVTAIFPAHIHVEAYRFGTPREIAGAGVYFTPSISPIYGNRPGFKVFEYDDKDFQVSGVKTFYYAGQGRWEE